MEAIPVTTRIIVGAELARKGRWYNLDMKLIYIEWQDAVANSKWFSFHEAHNWHDDDTKWIVREVGWLIKEDKHGITIAGRWQPENLNAEASYGQLQYIPKPWILKRKTLKV